MLDAWSTRRAELLESTAPGVVVPRPFCKWVGGKRQLLRRILPLVPAKFGVYHEPFVGGGALFFAVQPRRAHLSDVNDRLVRTYRGVQREVEAVIERLARFPYDRSFFDKLRERDVESMKHDAEVAAWLIYLNKTGYNGLYRVNSKNRFNVPFGHYKTPPLICDEKNLRACAEALEGAQVHCEDFAKVLDRASARDFVYFDPPYVPLSVTSYFTSYTSGGFDMDDQRRLRDVALALKQKGVHVLLSNSSAPAVRELYKKGFELHEVEANRMVNCKASGRGKITELLIT
jgi:DNA adenine methylase